MIKVVVIGNSPLSYFLAQALDKELGQLVHAKLNLIKPSSGTTHLPTATTLLGKTGFGLPLKTFHGLKVAHDSIKSINLKEKRIITAKKVIEYDFLVVDQTAVYSDEELRVI